MREQLRNVDDESIVLVAIVMETYSIETIQRVLGNFGGKASPERITEVIQRRDPLGMSQPGGQP